MNNEELMKKLQICIEEYMKLQSENEALQSENEALQNYIIAQEEAKEQLNTCIVETNKIINRSKENLKSAEKCIAEMQFLVEYYQKTTSIMLEQLEISVERIKEEDGDIDKIIQEIKLTKESIHNLNNIDL